MNKQVSLPLKTSENTCPLDSNYLLSYSLPKLEMHALILPIIIVFGMVNLFFKNRRVPGSSLSNNHLQLRVNRKSELWGYLVFQPLLGYFLSRTHNEMQQKLMAVIWRLHLQTFLSLEPTTSYAPRDWRPGHLSLSPRPRTVAGPPQVLMLRWYE